jgi:hypothetical protein
MADLMPNKQRTVGSGTDILGADRPALSVEYCACAFEHDVAALNKDEFKLEAIDGRVHKRHWFQRIGSARYQLTVQASRYNPDCFKSIQANLTVLEGGVAVPA